MMAATVTDGFQVRGMRSSKIEPTFYLGRSCIASARAVPVQQSFWMSLI
jgi:hypothetical protein